jgi:hypothetical protein
MGAGISLCNVYVLVTKLSSTPGQGPSPTKEGLLSKARYFPGMQSSGEPPPLPSTLASAMPQSPAG